MESQRVESSAKYMQRLVWLAGWLAGRDLAHCDTTAKMMQMFDTLLLASRRFPPPSCVISLIQTDARRAAPIPTFILAEFNYAFPFCLSHSPSHSHSSKTLKTAEIIFHNAVPGIINLSWCSFTPCSAAREGGEDGGQISVTSITGLFITRLPLGRHFSEEREATAAFSRITTCLLPT